ncbi:immunity protein Imm5 [Niabella sp. CC-SYL272]|uniref:Imm5 family immunity protein n=1 Tax=Niabella agricola TaxID=2891571 RepID=UPI001F3C95BF|nr:Imm5 family immunity protein [Niabella agricola]MCF3109116.1 immunity protein Imm5 [Niabella agricola]
MLEQVLAAAVEALNENPQGHLPLKHRVAVMKSLNNSDIVNKLFLECTKKVLPVWYQDFPENASMTAMLTRADAFLYNQEPTDFMKLGDQYRNYMESTPGMAGMAGLSAVSLCYSIATGAAMILDIEDYDGQDDGSFDWDTWNPDFYASIAFAGGNPFVNEGNPQKRRAFWQWYLEAIDQLAQQPGERLSDIPKTEAVVSETFSRTQTYRQPALVDLLKKVIELSLADLQKSDPDVQWEQLELSGECMKAGIGMKGFYISGGNKVPFKLKYFLQKGDQSTIILMNKIKYAMYEQAPKEGAWMGFRLVAEKNQDFTLDLNYDLRTALPESRQDPENFKQEFEAFPRAKAYTPDWWQAILGKKAAYL